MSTKVNGRGTLWMAMVSSDGPTANDMKAITRTIRSTDMAAFIGQAGKSTKASGRMGSSMVKVS